MLRTAICWVLGLLLALFSQGTIDLRETQVSHAAVRPAISGNENSRNWSPGSGGRHPQPLFAYRCEAGTMVRLFSPSRDTPKMTGH